MVNKRKTIRKQASLVFIPFVIITICMFACMLTCIVGYNKTFRFYTEEYYITADFSASLNNFNADFLNYQSGEVQVNYQSVLTKYEELKDSCDDLYDIRFDFNNKIRSDIENINTQVNVNIFNALPGLEAEDDAETMADIAEYIASAGRSLSNVLDIAVTEGNAKYEARKISAYVSEGLMIFVLLCAVGVTIRIIIFINRRVAKPIEDICEWSKLFKDDYTDMTELKHEGNDEISDLVESFNIVKDRLVESKKLRKDNEEAVRKLREEEEYKKKFVKQLYDEKREKETISSEAKRDGLTGLYNRRSFDALIDEFVGNKPASTEGSLFLIDMDNFKSVNDSLGHLAGDEALKTLAGAMRVVFPGGYLGRYGGDEFIAFSTGTVTEEQQRELGQALCDKMNMMFEYEGKTKNISVSVGIVNTVGITDYAELYMKADKALYYSKEHGRNQCTLASQIDLSN